jgi:hypothetical protein
MPTPESELFLAKKPKVAPTFEGVDYDDNTALKAAQDAIIREQWVKSMMARLVRDEMGKCYRREGVNHLEKCGHLRGRSILVHKTMRELEPPKRNILGRRHWWRRWRHWHSVTGCIWNCWLTDTVQSDTLSFSRMPRSRDTSSRNRTLTT